MNASRTDPSVKPEDHRLVWVDDLAVIIALMLDLPNEAPVPLRASTRDGSDWHTDVAHTVMSWLDPDHAADPTNMQHWEETTATRLVRALISHPDIAGVDAEGATVRITLTTEAILRVVPDVLAGRFIPELDSRAVIDPTTVEPGPWKDPQFVHARARNVSRNARAHGVLPAAVGDEPPALEPVDRRLLITLAPLKTVLRVGSLKALQAHARAITSAYQAWYSTTRTSPRGDKPITSLHRTRLAMNDALALALAHELTAVGLDAPEQL